jgi:hypothetical protein
MPLKKSEFGPETGQTLGVPLTAVISAAPMIKRIIIGQAPLRGGSVCWPKTRPRARLLHGVMQAPWAKGGGTPMPMAVRPGAAAGAGGGLRSMNSEEDKTRFSFRGWEFVGENKPILSTHDTDACDSPPPPSCDPSLHDRCTRISPFLATFFLHTATLHHRRITFLRHHYTSRRPRSMGYSE